jgi:hypothetical protein
MSALDLEFNRAVLDITAHLLPNGFDVSMRAPSTYRELKAHVAATGRLVVYAGASDRTIYGDPAVNHAFRAWHDYCHLLGGYDTSFVGEVAVCRAQERQLLHRYGDSERTFRWKKIVEADIIGQARYFERHGTFPVDQAAFVRAYLHDLAQALCALC